MSAKMNYTLAANVGIVGRHAVLFGYSLLRETPTRLAGIGRGVP
jgi:hypothetical protein